MMFFLVSIALASTLFGILNLYYLQVKFLSHSRFFASEKGSFTLMANNYSKRPLYDLNFYYQEMHLSIDALSPNENHSLTFESTFETRGRHALESVKVESLFPLIHERKFRYFDSDSQIIVYPKPSGISLLKRLSTHKDLQGDIDDFKGVRRFEEGESISRIHWSSLAKTHTLMSKEFSYTQTKEKLHFSYDELKGGSEERLSQLTLWVIEASELGYEFTLSLGAKTYDSTKEDLDALLTQLALY